MSINELKDLLIASTPLILIKCSKNVGRRTLKFTTEKLSLSKKEHFLYLLYLLSPSILPIPVPWLFKTHSAKNVVISPDFLVWKFCGKVQFPHQEIR